MSILPRSGARRLQRLSSLKYYNTLKWENRFTLGLDTAKNTHYIKKSCRILNFIQKSQQAHMSNSPRSGARGLKDFVI